MDTDKIEARPSSPWVPMTDRVMLQVFGKLMEELGELQSAVSRCVIQGLEESEPVTGKPNREWLCEEIADVQACISILMVKIGMTSEELGNQILRASHKITYLTEWHAAAEQEKKNDT